MDPAPRASPVDAGSWALTAKAAHATASASIVRFMSVLDVSVEIDANTSVLATPAEACFHQRFGETPANAQEINHRKWPGRSHPGVGMNGGS